MPTWNELPLHDQSRRQLITYFDRLGGAADPASVAGTLVGHMRTMGWSYTPTATGAPLAEIFAAKKINCDRLSDLLNFLYAYKNHPNNVIFSTEHVHQPNHPVFLPKIKIQHTGLKITENVSGTLSGVFFNSGHRVPSLAGTCYDLISGHRGPKAAMDLAYVRCTKIRTSPVEVYQLDYMGKRVLLTKQTSTTDNGLSKYKSSYGS